MFEEAQLYAPVTRSGEGDVTVHLSDNHPGAVDPEYRARRNALAALAMEWQPGTPPPVAAYTEAEHDVWRIVCGELHGCTSAWPAPSTLRASNGWGFRSPAYRSSSR